MIDHGFEEAFTKEWIENQITDSTNELVILRQVIPWQAILTQLTPFYDNVSGRLGKWNINGCDEGCCSRNYRVKI